MIDRIHEHIIAELQQNTKSDTIFILAAIVLNIATLATNSAVASGKDGGTQALVMILFIALTVVVNLVVITGLQKGKQTRQKLTEGLLNMYKDQGVDSYYDPSLLSNYSARYNLFIVVIVFMGVIAIAIPLIIR